MVTLLSAPATTSAVLVNDQEKRVNEEIDQLLRDIRRIGPTHPEPSPHVLFGELFDDDDVQQYYEALVGTLKSAKKRGFITFKGQMLLKGAHDHVLISIVGEDDPSPEGSRPNEKHGHGSIQTPKFSLSQSHKAASLSHISTKSPAHFVEEDDGSGHFGSGRKAVSFRNMCAVTDGNTSSVGTPSVGSDPIGSDSGSIDATAPGEEPKQNHHNNNNIPSWKRKLKEAKKTEPEPSPKGIPEWKWKLQQAKREERERAEREAAKIPNWKRNLVAKTKGTTQYMEEGGGYEELPVAHDHYYSQTDQSIAHSEEQIHSNNNSFDAIDEHEVVIEEVVPSPEPLVAPAWNPPSHHQHHDTKVRHNLAVVPPYHHHERHHGVSDTASVAPPVKSKSYSRRKPRPRVIIEGGGMMNSEKNLCSSTRSSGATAAATHDEDDFSIVSAPVVKSTASSIVHARAMPAGGPNLAKIRAESEVHQLLDDIRRVGSEPGEPRVTFGELFDDDIVQQTYEALVGTLRSAKRQGLITFNGQVLFKGMHDHVVIEIVQK